MKEIKELVSEFKIIINKKIKNLIESGIITKDDLKYRYGFFLKLKDDRKILITIRNDNINWIYIDNTIRNTKVNAKNKCSFSISIEEFDENEEVFIHYQNTDINKEHNFEISLRLPEKNNELNEKDKKILTKYMNTLVDQAKLTLEYDQETTYSIYNLSSEGMNEYQRQQFNKEMSKLNQTSKEAIVLPAVEAAINWLIDPLKIPENSCSLLNFCNLLAQKFMNKLQKGEIIHLNFSDNIKTDNYLDLEIQKIISDANFFFLQGWQHNYKMIITPNSVHVSVNDNTYERIFSNSNEDEIKKITLSKK